MAEPKTWTATFLKPAKRMGGLAREITRDCVAPTEADAREWARIQAGAAGWIALRVEAAEETDTP